MPMIAPQLRPILLLMGVATLAAAWSVLPQRLLGPGFAAHMATHLAVVCIAAPLLASAVADTRASPVRLVPVLFMAVPASLVEMAVVWGWHAPAAHNAAQWSAAVRALEQGSFLFAGLVLWLAVLDRRPAGDGRNAVSGVGKDDVGRAACGIVALLLTSMHMTVLGVLLALAPRPLFAASAALCTSEATALADQQTGGTLMLIVGGLVYLAGGLALTARLLRRAQPDPGFGLRRPTS